MMSYKFSEDRLVYLYKVVLGTCSHSFALNAAKIAGLPPKVLENAKQKSKEFERNNHK